MHLGTFLRWRKHTRVLDFHPIAQLHILEFENGEYFSLYGSNGNRNSFKEFFIFTPKIGEMIHFDDHIFQRGWFNHQLGMGFSGDVWWVKIRLGCLGLECQKYQLFGKQKGIASWTNQTDPRIRCRVFTTCCVSALSLGKIGGCNGAPFCWKVGCFWVGNLGLKNTQCIGYSYWVLMHLWH